MKYSGKGIPEKILDCAVLALHRWNEEGLTLDEIIDTLRTEYPDSARSASDLLFSYFRHKEGVDTLLERASSKGTIRQELKEIASCALSQALFQTGIAPESAVNLAVEKVKKEKDRFSANFMNALLRNALRMQGTFPMSPSFPKKLRSRWKKTMGESCEEAVAACGINPPPVFRLRNGDPLPDTEELKTDFTGAFRFFTGISIEKLLASPAFREGRIYIQDPATALSVTLAGKIAGKVWDACAAPGGKTVLLHDRAEPGTVLFASDRSLPRLKLLKENLQRSGLRDVHCFAADAADPEKAAKTGPFDLVFLDAPCSNSGVARRRPDALWRFSLRRLESVRKLQRELLDAAAGAVAPGGILLYSTCSVEEEEDSAQVRNFLLRHPEFTLEESRLLVPSLIHDGAFAARLRKRG